MEIGVRMSPWVCGCVCVGVCVCVCVKHGYSLTGNNGTLLTGNNGRLQYLRFCLCEMYVNFFFGHKMLVQRSEFNSG